ncbi:class I heat shock protein-like [Senna tora]|uniref:Class I heat shock protein-like n=1 Tax=Senna tora TaxID=362788 RepID=A0A834VXE3_9FABA|nr:class I heat shock protein-like [Senna tora]
MSMVNKCPVLSTPTDWKETKDAHVFISDIPGLKKDQVNVEIIEEGGITRVLQISGDRDAAEINHDEERDDDKNKDTWHRAERCRGKFRRRFRLPENARVDEVKASMENGVLVVTIPKQEVEKPKSKALENPRAPPEGHWIGSKPKEIYAGLPRLAKKKQSPSRERSSQKNPSGFSHCWINHCK